MVIIIAFLSVLVCLFIYFISVFFIKDQKWQLFVSGASLEFISGGALAAAIVVVGYLLEKNWEKNAEKRKIDSEISNLISRLKNNFRRGKSSWNFSNRGPTFYFDTGWINPTYDLLTSENGKWEASIYQYSDYHEKETLLIKVLKSFVESMELSLIDAERLDKKLVESIISPKLAASMGSGYSADRASAQLDGELEYWVTRAAWAGASATEIIFGLARYTTSQLTIQKVQSLCDSAEAHLKKDNVTASLVKKIRDGRKNLTKQLTAIQKHL